jgi:hypothetical protein
MILINLIEDCVLVQREPATPREVFEAALVMFIGASLFSAIVLIILNGLAAIMAD